MSATTDPCQKIADLIASLQNSLATDQKELLAAKIPEQKVALQQAIVAIEVQIRSETALLTQCRDSKGGTGTGTGGKGTGGVPKACQALAATVATLEAERTRLFALLAKATIEQKVLIESELAALGVVLRKDQQNLAACVAHSA